MSEWISVEDRLPDDTGRYWCYVTEHGELGKSSYQWNIAYNVYAEMFEEVGVTHWQPLPEPPKEQ